MTQEDQNRSLGHPLILSCLHLYDDGDGDDDDGDGGRLWVVNYFLSWAVAGMID